MREARRLTFEDPVSTTLMAETTANSAIADALAHTREIKGAVDQFDEMAVAEHRRLKAYWRAQQEALRRKMEDKVLEARLECLVASIEAFEAFDSRRKALASEHNELFRDVKRDLFQVLRQATLEGPSGQPAPEIAAVRSRLLERSRSEGSLSAAPYEANPACLALVRRAEISLKASIHPRDCRSRAEGARYECSRASDRTIEEALSGEVGRGRVLATLQSAFKARRKLAGRGFDADVRAERDRHTKVVVGMHLFLQDLAAL